MKNLKRLGTGLALLALAGRPGHAEEDYPEKALTRFVPFIEARHVFVPHDSIAFSAHQGRGEAGWHLAKLMGGQVPTTGERYFDVYSTDGLTWVMGGGREDGTYVWTKGKGAYIDPSEPRLGYKKRTSYRSPPGPVQTAVTALEPQLKNRVAIMAWCNSDLTRGCSGEGGGFRGSEGAHVTFSGPLNRGGPVPAGVLVIPGLRGDGESMRMELSSDELRSVLGRGHTALTDMGFPALHDPSLEFDAVSGDWNSRVSASQMPRVQRSAAAGARSSRGLRGAANAFDVIGTAGAVAHAYTKRGARGVGELAGTTAAVVAADRGARAAGNKIISRFGARMAGKVVGHGVKRFIPGVGWILTARDAYEGYQTYASNDVIKYEERIAEDPVWWLTYQVVYGLGLY